MSPLKENGALRSESLDKARLLLDQYKSVFTPREEIDPADMPKVSKTCSETISGINVCPNGVFKLLSNLNAHKAAGPDMVPNMVLKTCAASIAPGLSLIFQRSVDTGDLPESWLKAFISSVFKKGNRHLPENYRPISLTCVVSKILEHIICKQLRNHLESNNILTDLNHGFRSGYSCESQLLVTTHDLLQTFDAGSQVDLAILDFSKAFDTVPHNKLLHKLQEYGVKGPLHKWLSNFLTKRTMQVVIEGVSSEETPVISGVPQGTVLGPLLFLCHINDLPDSVKSQVRLFADDCLVYRPIRSQADHTALQKDLHSLEQWAKDWGMRFNAKKCYIMSIKPGTKAKSHHFYTLNDTILQQVAQNPYLGVEISDNMKWSNHITKIASKGNRTLGFLRRNLKNCPASCRLTAYLA